MVVFELVIQYGSYFVVISIGILVFIRVKVIILVIIADVRVVILLVVLWSFDISSRKSIYGSSVCNGVVGLVVVNIVSFFVLV